MLRATSGWRRIKPARSMVKTICMNRRVVLTRNSKALHVGSAGGRRNDARTGVDEGQILALLFDEALPTGTTRSA